MKDVTDRSHISKPYAESINLSEYSVVTDATAVVGTDVGPLTPGSEKPKKKKDKKGKDKKGKDKKDKKESVNTSESSPSPKQNNSATSSTSPKPSQNEHDIKFKQHESRSTAIVSPENNSNEYESSDETMQA